MASPKYTARGRACYGSTGGRSGAPTDLWLDGPACRHHAGCDSNSDRGQPWATARRQLTRDSSWKLVASVPIKFTTHHPQGMVKIGDTLFVSSVEIKVRTRRLATPIDGYDRDTGEGVGHLFKIDLQGNLLADLVLGEGSIYHPGGIDYDGRHIWVPVAEYRPNSRSIVYRVDPDTMKASEVFRFADHIGALVHDTDDRTLHGISWGSRRFYRWPLSRSGSVTNQATRARAAAHAEHVTLCGLPGLQIRGQASHAVHRGDRDTSRRQTWLRSGSEGWTSSICATDVRGIRCRCSCGRQAGWT